MVKTPAMVKLEMLLEMGAMEELPLHAVQVVIPKADLVAVEQVVPIAKAVVVEATPVELQVVTKETAVVEPVVAHSMVEPINLTKVVKD
jgi:hypothetical protein